MDETRMQHFPERKLRPGAPGDATRVLWARRPPKAAVVFVHGYRGEAIATWSRFDALLPTRPKAAEYDLFFYGYNCYSSSTTAQARLLCDFLEGLHQDPGALLRESLRLPDVRPDPFSYAEVIVIAHSIGAIVSRRALLSAGQLKRSWGSRTRQVFFAPAHRGAIVSQLVAELSGSWLSFLIAGFRHASPLMDEVAPGSLSIVELQADIAREVATGATHLLATRVVIAEVDRVVSNLKLHDLDPVPVVVPGSTHTSVCKPRPGFLQPLTEVEAVL